MDKKRIHQKQPQMSRWPNQLKGRNKTDQNRHRLLQQSGGFLN